ncbi:maleylpyruvate isomerase family mycothiol-dependent enzyme [Streptomyces sp. NPDC021020]|uniref:maleylpyruvate isomerase family mycothiol-dependent enzyme n=1 Tax=Streptomyces sp. NPDC021020 TaxID=3365109 RepID=UPI003799B121
MAVTERTAGGTDGEGAAEQPEPDLQEAFAAGLARLRGLTGELTDEALRAPSALPGWTRGHVLTHIEGVGQALARQARYALRGRTIEVYDGGRPARDAAIEAGHGRPAARLTAALADALDEAEASWAAVGPGDWGRPVAYRDGTLRTVGLAWWRELEIHTVDALLGAGPSGWSPQLCTHLLDFLSVRAPGGVGLTVTAVDTGEVWTYGRGAPIAVEGRLTDLAAWFAGRRPEGPLEGGPLPELGNWP